MRRSEKIRRTGWIDDIDTRSEASRAGASTSIDTVPLGAGRLYGKRSEAKRLNPAGASEREVPPEWGEQLGELKAAGR